MVISGQPGLGFSLKKFVKTAVNPYAATKAVTKASYGVTKKAAKTAYKYRKIIMPLETFAVWATAKTAQLALRPIKSRVQKIVNGRALKLAQERRHSNQPTPAERAEARAWTKSSLKKHLPHGPLLALLAGPPPQPTLSGADEATLLGNLGVAPAVIAALIPVLAALAQALIKSYSKSGAISAQGGGTITAQGGGGGGGGGGAEGESGGGGAGAGAEGSFTAQVNYDVQTPPSSSDNPYSKLVEQGQNLIEAGKQFVTNAQNTKMPEANVRADVNITAEGSMEGAALPSNIGFGVGIAFGVLALGTGLFVQLRH